MIEFEAFVAGLASIGIACRQAPTVADHEAYYIGLGRELESDEWARFTEWALRPCRWTMFPKLREIQDSLREFRGERPLLVEATDAYERVLASGTYSPEGGTSWTFRAVKESCGDAAAEAFLAAGGHSAFATTWDESKRRERFANAYAEAVREEPAAALLPAGPVKALPSGEAEPSKIEAAGVIQKLSGMVPAPVKVKARIVEASDDRIEELRRQAAEIQQ